MQMRIQSNYTEKPELDRTIYSQEELDYLRSTYPLVNNAWNTANVNGIKITKTEGRFGYVYNFLIDNFGWMFTNPIDLLDHKKILTDYSGDILFTGLGLGLCVVFANNNPKINSITIVEKEQRVIDLMSSMLNLEKANIICADADTYTPTRTYDYIFLDHAKEKPNQDVINSYSNYSPNVDIWYDIYMQVGDKLASN